MIEPYILYYNKDSIDLTIKDSTERTNSERMKIEGLCPIDSTSKEFNYHHLSQHDEYTAKKPFVVLISEIFYTKQSGQLHFPKNFYTRPKTVERTAFATWRKEANKELVKVLEKERLSKEKQKS